MQVNSDREETIMKQRVARVVGVLAVCAALAACATGPSGDGWVTLFDGTSLNNWYTIGDANWRIEGGAVVADKRTGKDYGYLVTRKSYADFRIKAEFWVSDDANSGIYMRCGNSEVINDKICYEANVFDQRKDPSYGTGAVTNIAKVDPMPRAGGKWNTYDITLKGDHITLILNGARTVEIRDKKFTNGRIALQYAAGVVKFRRVEIKEL